MDVRVSNVGAAARARSTGRVDDGMCAKIQIEERNDRRRSTPCLRTAGSGKYVAAGADYRRMARQVGNTPPFGRDAGAARSPDLITERGHCRVHTRRPSGPVSRGATSAALIRLPSVSNEASRGDQANSQSWRASALWLGDEYRWVSAPDGGNRRGNASPRPPRGIGPCRGGRNSSKSISHHAVIQRTARLRIALGG